MYSGGFSIIYWNVIPQLQEKIQKEVPLWVQKPRYKSSESPFQLLNVKESFSASDDFMVSMPYF